MFAPAGRESSLHGEQVAVAALAMAEFSTTCSRPATAPVRRDGCAELQRQFGSEIGACAGAIRSEGGVGRAPISGANLRRLERCAQTRAADDSSGADAAALGRAGAHRSAQIGHCPTSTTRLFVRPGFCATATFDLADDAGRLTARRLVCGPPRRRLTRQERHAEILALLRREGTVRIATLARAFAVTTETARRDLDELAQAGALKRTYGGGAGRSPTDEPGIGVRSRARADERARIGAAAAMRVEAGDVLMIDCGSTTSVRERAGAQSAPDRVDELLLRRGRWPRARIAV
jgi:DNA-binding Lrp family transcriptional regulator